MPQRTPLCRTQLGQIATLVATVWIVAATGWTWQEPSPTPPVDGETIYRQLCSECHGPDGAGVPGKFEHSLSGARSQIDLAAYIEQAMPDGNPERCVGAEAAAVAQFIRERFQPASAPPAAPRIELVHLTNPQYENAISDAFRWLLDEPPVSAERGLQVEYFAAKDPKPDKRLEGGLTSELEVDLLNRAPFQGLAGDDGFYVRWEGAVFAEESGEYTFHVHSPNGFRLLVNDPRTPLIDNWVSTATEPDQRGSIKLIGGRWYNLRLEAFRFKDPEFKLRLTWQRPRRVPAAIPREFLSPGRVAPVIVCSTEFPPDDSSGGYPRGTLVSKEWDAATTEAAIEIADRVTSSLPFFVGAPADAGPEKLADRARDFCHRFATQAFRRELTADERERYIEHFFGANDPPLEATQRALLAILKSPWFLYIGLPAERRGGEEVAERLAWCLWDSLPDLAMQEAARRGQLAEPAAIRSTAERMLAEPAARRKLRAFFTHWLRLEDASDLSKDPGMFGTFDAAFVDDLQESLLRFVDDCTWGSDDDFRRLLRSDQLWINPRLAEFYGLSWPSPPADNPAVQFAPVTVDAQTRAGLLTHPLLLSQLAYYRSTSPIHRGVFVSRQLLGVKLNPPPVAVEPLGEDFDPAMTTRQRVEFQTRPDNCMSCHRVINPLGFALENLDAVGRIRSTEREQPVDTRVAVDSGTGQRVELNGPRELAEYLAASPEVHRHFVETLFQYLVKQPVAAYGPETLRQLTERFIASGFRIRPLVVDIAVTAAEQSPHNTPVSRTE